jgi:YbbR domain-containing protein
METLTSLEVPVEYVNRDSRMQILFASDNTVRLHLSGSGALINSMRPDQVQVTLDLSNAVNGENSFTITSDNIAVPPGVRLNRIEPSEIKVSLDLPVAKMLPIQVDWVGSLPPGLVLKSVQLMPGKTKVVGAERLLDGITTIYTEKIHLENLKTSGRIKVDLALEPASLKIADDHGDAVEVRYIITERSS